MRQNLCAAFPPPRDSVGEEIGSEFMKRIIAATILLAGCSLVTSAWAGQAPGAASDRDVPISHHDRVYAAEQFSNTVSVTETVLENCSAA